ncbi:MAG: hypothetical protein ABGZ23_17875 [Fuerstiella sp.]|nr:hypothetical protein [Fuerstiella sp.]
MSVTLNHEINNAIALLWITMAGCSVTTLSDRPGMHVARQETPEVSRILVIWHPTTQDSTEKENQGFQGTLMFFQGNNPTPQRVSHRTVVMLFHGDDDTWTLRRQFRFTPAAWNSHERTPAIGTVYHVFVPVSEDPGSETHLGIRVQHTSENGKTTLSELAEMAIDPRQDIRTHGE